MSLRDYKTPKESKTAQKENFFSTYIIQKLQKIGKNFSFHSKESITLWLSSVRAVPKTQGLIPTTYRIMVVLLCFGSSRYVEFMSLSGSKWASAWLHDGRVHLLKSLFCLKKIKKRTPYFCYSWWIGKACA